MQSANRLKPHHLEVLASFFTDLAAGWFLSIFIARDPWVLTGDIFGVIFSLYIAFAIKKKLEEL